MDAQLAVTEEEVREILEASSFARIYDFRLDFVAYGECRLLMPFQEALARPGGIVSGPALMAAAYVAMWLAIITRLGKDALAVTTEMTTAFLSSARQEDIICAAKVMRLGRSRIYGIAECRNDRGKLIAHHTINYIRR
ncbi:MAG: PaaI family thioesterase [Blastocatellia bacterium]